MKPALFHFSMKRTLCTPCFIQLAEVYDVRRTGQKTEKITCDECGRRRYGGEYTITKKRGTAHETVEGQ